MFFILINTRQRPNFQQFKKNTHAKDQQISYCSIFLRPMEQNYLFLLNIEWNLMFKKRYLKNFALKIKGNHSIGLKDA